MKADAKVVEMAKRRKGRVSGSDDDDDDFMVSVFVFLLLRSCFIYIEVS